MESMTGPFIAFARTLPEVLETEIGQGAAEIILGAWVKVAVREGARRRLATGAGTVAVAMASVLAYRLDAELLECPGHIEVTDEERDD